MAKGRERGLREEIETEGRKEGRNIARRRNWRHSPNAIHVPTCFQILMSRDLLYPRRVRWSEWLAPPPPISGGRREATVAQTVHHCGRTSLSGLDCKNFSCRIVAHFIAPCAAREGGREGRISGRGNWGRGRNTRARRSF